jgi:hypothetical protein
MEKIEQWRRNQLHHLFIDEIGGVPSDQTYMKVRTRGIHRSLKLYRTAGIT